MCTSLSQFRTTATHSFLASPRPLEAQALLYQVSESPIDDYHSNTDPIDDYHSNTDVCMLPDSLPPSTTTICGAPLTLELIADAAGTEVAGTLYVFQTTGDHLFVTIQLHCPYVLRSNVADSEAANYGTGLYAWSDLSLLGSYTCITYTVDLKHVCDPTSSLYSFMPLAQATNFGCDCLPGVHPCQPVDFTSSLDPPTLYIAPSAYAPRVDNFCHDVGQYKLISARTTDGSGVIPWNTAGMGGSLAPPFLFRNRPLALPPWAPSLLSPALRSYRLYFANDFYGLGLDSPRPRYKNQFVDDLVFIISQLAQVDPTGLDSPRYKNQFVDDLVFIISQLAQVDPTGVLVHSVSAGSPPTVQRRRAMSSRGLQQNSKDSLPGTSLVLSSMDALFGTSDGSPGAGVYETFANLGEWFVGTYGISDAQTLDEGQGGPDVGVIVGAVVGGLVAVAGSVALAMWLLRQRRHSRRPQAFSTDDLSPGPTPRPRHKALTRKLRGLGGFGFGGLGGLDGLRRTSGTPGGGGGGGGGRIAPHSGKEYDAGVTHPQAGSGSGSRTNSSLTLTTVDGGGGGFSQLSHDAYTDPLSSFDELHLARVSVDPILGLSARESSFHAPARTSPSYSTRASLPSPAFNPSPIPNPVVGFGAGEGGFAPTPHLPTPHERPGARGGPRSFLPPGLPKPVQSVGFRGGLPNTADARLSPSPRTPLKDHAAEAADVAIFIAEPTSHAPLRTSATMFASPTNSITTASAPLVSVSVSEAGQGPVPSWVALGVPALAATGPFCEEPAKANIPLSHTSTSMPSSTNSADIISTHSWAQAAMANCPPLHPAPASSGPAMANSVLQYPLTSYSSGTASNGTHRGSRDSLGGGSESCSTSYGRQRALWPHSHRTTSQGGLAPSDPGLGPPMTYSVGPEALPPISTRRSSLASQQAEAAPHPGRGLGQAWAYSGGPESPPPLNTCASQQGEAASHPGGGLGQTQAYSGGPESLPSLNTRASSRASHQGDTSSRMSMCSGDVSGDEECRGQGLSPGTPLPRTGG
eukprot:gene23506-11974_t